MFMFLDYTYTLHKFIDFGIWNFALITALVGMPSGIHPTLEPSRTPAIKGECNSGLGRVNRVATRHVRFTHRCQLGW